MTRKSGFLFFCIICAFFITPLVSAETIFLKNGETLEGKIIKYTDDIITVETIKNEPPRDIKKMDINLINLDSSSMDKYLKFKSIQESSLVYLKNGEIIKGKITQFNTDFVTIESTRGHGVLQVPAKEINLITSASKTITMSQRSGIGYVQHKSTLNSSYGPATYSSDQVSYKFFLDEEMFGDILFAFGNASVGNQELKVLALDYRMGLIFDKTSSMLLYYGGSFGMLQVKDTASNVDGSGYSLKGFLGAEMFFDSLPNFGFAGEIGFGYRNAGDYKATDISTSTFPSFSIHYYY